MNISPTSRKFIIVPDAVVTIEDLKNLILTLILQEGIVVDGDITGLKPIMHMLQEVSVLTQEQILQRQVALQNEISGLSKLMPSPATGVSAGGEGKQDSASSEDDSGNQEEEVDGVSGAAEATCDTTEAGNSSSTVQ